MKKRCLKLFVLLLFGLLVPVMSVNAGGSSSCSTLNSNVQIDWNHGYDGKYTSLAGGGVYWCLTTNKADYTSAAMGGQIYELMYVNTASGLGKFRVFCMDQGLNAPAESALQYKKVIWDKGPACAFYKFSSLIDDGATSTEIRHNRIRYIQRNSDATFNCTDEYLTTTCLGGSRKNQVSDKGKISISTLAEYSEDSNYYIYKASGISMSGNANGKPTKYTPKLSPSVSGAIIATSASATSSISSTTSSATLYIKIPKSAVTSSSKFTLTLNASYNLSCHYSEFGIAVYQSKPRPSTEQRLAFRLSRRKDVSDSGSASASKAFTIVPDTTTTSILIQKENSAGTALSGATFGLYTNSNCTIPASGISNVTTGSDGTAIFSGVNKNTSYYIKEISAPSGYRASNECRLVNTGTSARTETFINTPTTTTTEYNLKVKKVDADTNEPIFGGIFLLFSDSSCINSITGTYSDFDGIATFTVGDTNTYYVQERIAPDGYDITDNSCKPISAGEMVTFADKKKEVEETYQDVSVKKVDASTNAALSGAKFALYTDNACTISVSDKDGNSIVTTGADGTGKFTVNSANEYYIKEIIPPDNYNLSTNPCKKAVMGDTVVYENEKLPNYVPIEIVKVDADDNSIKLAQAKFGLYSDSACSVPAKDYFNESSATTDGYGNASFIVEEDKTYYLKEEIAPSGYQLDSTCKKADLTNYMEFKNKKIPEEKVGSIKVNKVETGSRKGIAGVKFQLLGADKDSPAMDRNGNTLGEVVTDENGELTISNLYYGTYYLKEIDAPDIYVKEEVLKEVVVDSAVSSVTVENVPISVLFTKRDSLTNDSVNGGLYRVLTNDGELVKEFTIEDSYYSLTLAPGDYKFAEVEAPKDYINANVTFEFNVSDTGLVTIHSEESRYYFVYDGIGINIINDREEKVVDVPKTGNNSSRLMMLVAVVLVACGIFSIIIIRKRKMSN